MRKFIFSWLTFWIAVSALIGYYLLPLRDSLRFGIDLVGGTFLTLEVQTDKAVEADLLARMQVIPKKLKDADKALPVKKEVKNEQILLTFEDSASANAAAVVLRDLSKDLEQKVEDKVLEINLKPAKAKKIKSEAVKTNIEVFHTRLNKMGAEEISIAAKGEKQIVVELPDVSDPQQARALIGKPAVLEFKLVEKTGRTREDILYEYDGILPDGKEVLPDKNREDGKPTRYYLVPQYTDITGNLLRDSWVGIGGKLGVRPIVHFKFNSEGGDRFYDITSKNPQRSLAIVLDKEVISAPTINTAIRSEGYIEGDFGSEEAKELAMLLKSGSLVAPVTIEEDRQIAATLGEESIRKGLIACLVGLGLLFLFGLIYYKISGLLAFIALIFNLVLVLFGLSSIKATLTLPGIAGMVLTIGMAIDASILIYERIKEALASGVSVKKAVNAGFSNAMVVILDANITTFIVGVVLYQFGTGPIKGFAVTMMLGIIATLITGLLFLRSLFNFMLNTFNVKKLSI